MGTTETWNQRHICFSGTITIYSGILDEQAYRYNNRNDMSDFDRFKLAASKSLANVSLGIKSRANITNRKRILTEKEAKRQKRGKRKS